MALESYRVIPTRIKKGLARMPESKSPGRLKVNAIEARISHGRTRTMGARLRVKHRQCYCLSLRGQEQNGRLKENKRRKWQTLGSIPRVLDPQGSEISRIS